ncbi:MAG: lasso peptide biosynthesis B2 protein [bacterium]|nr:lasso peptide biosynthesis B2 protein [bacterium]
MKKELFFVGYSILNCFHVNRLVRSEEPLADIVAGLGRQNGGPADTASSPLGEGTPTRGGSSFQRRIANIAFFFSIFFPSAWRRRCYFSSLLVMKWARSLGIAPKLNIGLRQGLSDMEGHAWLSIDGSPYCERTCLYENYTVTLSEKDNLVYWYDE